MISSFNYEKWNEDVILASPPPSSSSSECDFELLQQKDDDASRYVIASESMMTSVPSVMTLLPHTAHFTYEAAAAAAATTTVGVHDSNMFPATNNSTAMMHEIPIDDGDDIMVSHDVMAEQAALMHDAAHFMTSPVPEFRHKVGEPSVV